MSATEYNLNLLSQGYYIARDDDEDNVGVIQDYVISNSVEEGDKITVTGTFAPMILGKRIIAQQTQLYGDFQDSIRNLIISNVINPTKSSRKISCIELGNYDNSITEAVPSHMAAEGMEKEEYDDPLYNEIVDFAVQTGKISASLIQRRFRLGYNRAARIIDLLEERGIIGPVNGSKPREVLVKLEGSNEEE